MDILELIKNRHSVRSYQDKKIESDKQEILNLLIEQINNEAELNIQIFYDEPECFNSFMAHYGKFTGVKNYICLVGKKSKSLDKKLGYYGEQIVLKAQSLGLNTCWVAMSHGKSKAKINSNESQRCLISIGYGISNGTPHKTKDVTQVSNYKEGMPNWFLQGIQSALLAPTAINQQKFYFELQDDNTVKGSTKKAFYTDLDLGIAQYHFEIASGKSVII